MMKRLVCAVLVALSMGCGGDIDGLDIVDSDDPIVGDGEIAGTPPDNGDGEEISSYDDYGASSSSGSGGSSSSGSGGSGGSGSGAVPPGILTAGLWDDNLNFEMFTAYRSGLLAGPMPGSMDISYEEHLAANGVAAPGAKTQIDISLVIDTTGSMGDEITYLQSEFDALSKTIGERYPASAQRWSLVTYRDLTDEYVVRWFDFRSDPSEFRSKLAQQSAAGGGDFPEAPDWALAIAHRLSWRFDDNTARLLFWVADAPHHGDNAPRLAKALRKSRDKSIHIYPVASSGVDELTELSMRTAAQLTGGRHIFLTDDSGVGGAHKEPSLPCYFVTHLDDAILRVIDIELSGEYREPAQGEIIRTGGDPQNGACQLESGPVWVF